jgi:cytochrome c-type biogenesis protein CcmH
MLWLIFALLTLAAVAILLVPLWRGASQEPPARIDYDIVVYKSQLKEIDQEIEQGLLTAAEAEAARAEVHRRMLAAEDAELAHRKRTAGASRIARFGAIAAVAVVVPVGGALLYSALGSPNLPGEPYAWRMKNDPAFVEASTADKLALMLQQNPNVAGYKRLADMYFEARDFAKAAEADHKALELGASDAETWSEFGEAVVMASGGAVVPQALSAFAKALTVDAHDNRSRFYVALGEAQIGNYRQAVAIWRDMEQGAPPDASWLGIVRQNITEFAKAGGFDPASVPPAPASVEQLNAANSAMIAAMHQMAGVQGPAPATPPAGNQGDMIHAMVARLAARLQTTPNDVEGWQRLAHAYNVLGENDKARAAIAHAVRLKPSDVGVQLSLAEIEKAAAPGEDQPADYLATMKTVLRLDPANTQALYAVGLAEAKAGHAARARQLWSKLLSLAAQDDPLVAKVRDQLQALPTKAD